MINEVTIIIFFFILAPPATNVIRQGSKALPTLEDRNNQYNGNKKTNGDNRSNSKPTGNIDKERIINIDTLNPYMNKFVERFHFIDRMKKKSIVDW